jgi:hypothetical protein
MPKIVVVGAVIACSHKGQVKLSSGDSRLSISGSAAVVSGMETGISFAPGSPGLVAPCPFKTTSTPPVDSPCLATGPATAGVSALWEIGGKGVLLDNARGLATNANDPSAQWSVSDPGQTTLNVDH